MGLFGRLTTGLRLARGSLSVLRDHPNLLVFPLVGGVAGLVFVATLFGSVFFGLGAEEGVVVYATFFAIYVGGTFIASFFTAGLMHATRQAFHGEGPTVKGGLAAAWRSAGTIFAWAVIAAIVGVIIRAIEESNDLAAKVVAVIFSLGWTVMTYFVVPVIVFEDTSLVGMFKRSGGLVRQVWGESLGAEAGVGIVTFLLVLLGALVAGAAFLVLPTGTTVGLFAVALIGGTAVIGAILVGKALDGIAKTAVYVYATEDETPDYFGHVDFGK